VIDYLISISYEIYMTRITEFFSGEEFFAVMSYVALGWLVFLVLGANAGIPVPDGLGLVVVGLTLWSIVYLYARLCRRFPAAGWVALGFFAGLFGLSRPVYVHTEVTVDDEGNEVAVYDDCDAATDDTYCDSGGSSDSRED
jgi:hypothetical protein